MDQQTIKGSTDDKGMFRAENPHPFDWEDKGLREFWEADHPSLPCYTPSNELVISRDNLKVVETWQWNYKPFAMQNGWRNVGLYAYEKYTFEQFSKANWGLQTRQVYLTVSPTETNMSDVPLSPMKPYHPVYTRETIQEIFNAQFATEAEGGESLTQKCRDLEKDNGNIRAYANTLEKALKDVLKNIMSEFPQIYEQKEIIRYALTAPSHNSSSEMVDLKDVRKILGLPTKVEYQNFEFMDDDTKKYYVSEFQWLVLPHVGWVKTDKENADKWNSNPEFSKRETRTIYKLKYL